MAVKTVVAVVNGTSYTLTYNSSTGAYESTITAPSSSSYPLDGHYYPVSVTATDDAGNETTVDDTDDELGSSCQLQVQEKVAPVITISSPTKGEYTSDNTPDITFTVTDDDSGVDTDTIVLTVDGTEVSGVSYEEIDSGYSCTYTVESALDDGEHTIAVNASDNDGNAATEVSVTFNVLTAAPTLSVSSPSDEIYTNVSTIEYAGSTDGETVTIQVGDGDAVEVEITDGEFSGTLTLTEGENVITIIATSAAGIITTITRTVYLDTVPPVFTSITITPNPVDAGNTYVISVVVTDE